MVLMISGLTGNFYVLEHRGHSIKLVTKKSQCNLDVRTYGFGRRVVNLWNALPKDIITCDSLHNCKSRLDIFFNVRLLRNKP